MREYDEVKKDLEKLLERDWGPRCKTKDTDDFEELLFPVGDPDVGRCPSCLVYEKFDKFWEYFAHE